MCRRASDSPSSRRNGNSVDLSPMAFRSGEFKNALRNDPRYPPPETVEIIELRQQTPSGERYKHAERKCRRPNATSGERQCDGVFPVRILQRIISTARVNRIFLRPIDRLCFRPIDAALSEWNPPRHGMPHFVRNRFLTLAVLRPHRRGRSFLVDNARQ